MQFLRTFLTVALPCGSQNCLRTCINVCETPECIKVLWTFSITSLEKSLSFGRRIGWDDSVGNSELLILLSQYEVIVYSAVKKFGNTHLFFQESWIIKENESINDLFLFPDMLKFEIVKNRQTKVQKSVFGSTTSISEACLNSPGHWWDQLFAVGRRNLCNPNNLDGFFQSFQRCGFLLRNFCF